jgi:hypothetical protein
LKVSSACYGHVLEKFRRQKETCDLRVLALAKP